MVTKVTMPEMGEGIIEGTISRWLKQPGDFVQLYEPILEIETDKVTTEATAEVAGTLLEIFVQQGETVSVGTLLAYLGESGETISDEVEQMPTTSQVIPAATAPRSKSTNGMTTIGRPYAGRVSPVVGRIAGEHQVDLNLVKGTGRDGRKWSRAFVPRPCSARLPYSFRGCAAPSTERYIGLYDLGADSILRQQ